MNRGIRLMLAAGLLAGAAPAPGLSEAQARGKQLFDEGSRGAGPPLTARMGMMSQRVPASVVPCTNCHGEDGRGSEKGGVLRPDITWAYLSRPDGHRHASGRSHPPFDRASFAAAITRGIDPAGNRLDPTMPRYALGGRDIDDLIAYLEWLGRAAAEGVPPGAE